MITCRQSRSGESIFWQARLKNRPVKTIWFYLIVLLNRYTPLQISISCKTIWGDKIHSFDSSSIGSIYFLGFYDMKVTLFLLRHEHDFGDFIDIGSNIGYYSLLMKNILKKDYGVYALEPTPSTFSILQKNVEPYEKIKIFEIALSNKNGTSQFTDYGERYAVFNSLQNNGLPLSPKKQKLIYVKTETLDNFCKTHSIRPSIIKIDTEGTESIILSHANYVLTRYRPIILIEVGGGAKWRQNNKNSLDFLEKHGYILCEITDNGYIRNHTRNTLYEYDNLVCIPEEKIAAYKKMRYEKI